MGFSTAAKLISVFFFVESFTITQTVHILMQCIGWTECFSKVKLELLRKKQQAAF